MKLSNYVVLVLCGSAAFAQDLPVPQKPVHPGLEVSSRIGTVGTACEPFQCMPHQTLAGLGEVLAVTVHAHVGSTFVLFAGLPSPICQPVLSIRGELGLWAPLITLEFGVIAAPTAFGTCGLGSLPTQFTVPTATPMGMQLRLQALGFGGTSELAFSRAVEVHVR
jgi:hypothetical protein